MENEAENFIDLENIPSEEKSQDLDIASYKINTYGTDFTVEIHFKSEGPWNYCPSFSAEIGLDTEKSQQINRVFPAWIASSSSIFIQARQNSGPDGCRWPTAIEIDQLFS